MDQGRLLRRLFTALPALLMIAVPALFTFASPAIAQQEDGTQQEMLRSSIERQQQSDAFALQLRQNQQLLEAAPDNRQALESLQLRQRQQFDDLNERQRAELRATENTPTWGPRLEQERRMALDRANQESGGPGR